MMVKRTGAVLIMLFWLLAACSGQSREHRFWKWFEKNQAMLLDFERDQERTFDKLSTAMNKVHPGVTFEFGPVEDGCRIFTISADGVRDQFPAVEALYAAAPALPKWKIVKFRQRDRPMGIRMAGLDLGPEDIEVAITPDSGLGGLTVFIRGYNEGERDKYAQAAFIMLDQAIGEYDMETKVGFIAFVPFDDTFQGERYTLADFPSAFDAFIGH